ncbi:MAG: diguanylate cyclase [Gammaproteobacteria bacterium]
MATSQDRPVTEADEHTHITHVGDLASVMGTSAPYLSIVHPRDAIISFELNEKGLILGRGISCDLQLPSGVISRRHCKVSCVGQSIVVEDLASTNGTYLDNQRVERAFLSPSNQLRVGPFLLKLEYKGFMEIRAQNQLLQAARMDPLTGIANRGWFIAQAARMLAGMKDPTRMLTAVLVDIDRFKNVNDQFGHAAGDAVLNGVAKILDSEKHDSHLLGRFGGEEFVMLLPDTGRQEALILCDRAREEIANKTFKFEGLGLNVNVSIGMATATQGEVVSLESLISDADGAMYRAKRLGRNRVCYTPIDEDPQY